MPNQHPTQGSPTPQDPLPNRSPHRPASPLRDAAGPGMRRSSPAWWPRRSSQTRSHPELGRQTLQRPWYCASRPGRVGRRQARQDRRHTPFTRPRPNTSRPMRPQQAAPGSRLPAGNPEGDAGWSSPVARQAHNLKAAGSNPAPATNLNCEASASLAASLDPDPNASIAASAPRTSIVGAAFG